MTKFEHDVYEVIF